MIKEIMIISLFLVLTGCAKKTEQIKVTYDRNSTVIYSLDKNYSVEFPEAKPINGFKSIVSNIEMSKLFSRVKVLILKNKKRDAIISSLEEKGKECQ